ncbi:MAG: hypothetical protein RL885_14910 [Planctomycetota bacterium]
MKIINRMAVILMMAWAAGSAHAFQECPGDPGYVLTVDRNIPTGAVAQATLDAPGAADARLLFSNGPGPTPSAFGDLCVTFPLNSPPYPIVIPASGQTTFDCEVPCEPKLVGRKIYMQFVAILQRDASQFGRSNSVELTLFDGGCGETCPIPADADQYGTAGGHAVTWGCGTEQAVKYVFAPRGDERFTEFGDGTASLTGLLVDPNDSQNLWRMNIEFSGRVNPGEPGYPPAGSPKKELAPGAYIENGGPVDASTWHYYIVTTGTLIGEGNNAGCSIQVMRMGEAFQVGVGASGKNVRLGASGWLDLIRTCNGGRPESCIGDINIELVPCPPQLR